MIKFDKIHAGMTLYQRGKQKMGNTTVTRDAEWPVNIVSVDSVTETAVIRWNGNAETKWRKHQLEKLYRQRKDEK